MYQGVQPIDVPPYDRSATEYPLEPLMDSARLDALAAVIGDRECVFSTVRGFGSNVLSADIATVLAGLQERLGDQLRDEIGQNTPLRGVWDNDPVRSERRAKRAAKKAGEPEKWEEYAEGFKFRWHGSPTTNFVMPPRGSCIVMPSDLCVIYPGRGLGSTETSVWYAEVRDWVDWCNQAGVELIILFPYQDCRCPVQYRDKVTLFTFDRTPGDQEYISTSKKDRSKWWNFDYLINEHANAVSPWQAQMLRMAGISVEHSITLPVYRQMRLRLMPDAPIDAEMDAITSDVLKEPGRYIAAGHSNEKLVDVLAADLDLYKSVAEIVLEAEGHSSYTVSSMYGFRMRYQSRTGQCRQAARTLYSVVMRLQHRIDAGDEKGAGDTRRWLRSLLTHAAPNLHKTKAWKAGEALAYPDEKSRERYKGWTSPAKLRSTDERENRMAYRQMDRELREDKRERDKAKEDATPEGIARARGWAEYRAKDLVWARAQAVHAAELLSADRGSVCVSQNRHFHTLYELWEAITGKTYSRHQFSPTPSEDGYVALNCMARNMEWGTPDCTDDEPLHMKTWIDPETGCRIDITLGITLKPEDTYSRDWFCIVMWSGGTSKVLTDAFLPKFQGYADAGCTDAAINIMGIKRPDEIEFNEADVVEAALLHDIREAAHKAKRLR